VSHVNSFCYITLNKADMHSWPRSTTPFCAIRIMRLAISSRTTNCDSASG
jgi:hypothetical protein